MNKITTYSLVIIAFAALSFTVVARNNLKVFAAPSDGCFTQVNLSSPIVGTIQHSNAEDNTTFPLQRVDPNARIKYSGFTYSVNEGTTVVTDVTGSVANFNTTGCPAPFNDFCCYRVQNVSGTWRITAIYYRS